MSSFARRRDRAVDALGALVVLAGLLAWAAEVATAGALVAAGAVLALGTGTTWGWPLLLGGGAWLAGVLGGRVRPGWWCPAFW